MRHLFIFAVALLLSQLAFPDVEVDSYSVFPSTLKPGLGGSVSITMSNRGDEGISGIVLVPSGSGFIFSSMTIPVGDLATGGSTVVTISFRTSPDIQPGSHTIQLAAYWSGGTASGSTYKLFSIPVTVESPALFQLSDIRVSKQPLIPGDAFNISARLRNAGGRATDIELSPSSTTFISHGQSRVLIGSLEQGQEIPISLSFSASLSSPSGSHSIPISVEYVDALGSRKETTLSLGPVLVSKSSVDFAVTLQGAPSAEPGGKARVPIVITNTGNDRAFKASVAAGGNSSLFTTLGPIENFVGDIGVGESKTISLEIGVAAEAQPGYYPIPLFIRYYDASDLPQPPITKGIGIEVAGINDVNAIATTSPSPAVPGGAYTLSIQISNTGTGPIRALKATASSPSLIHLSSPAYFIGSLEPDDYGTAQYSVLIKQGTPPGRLPVNLSIEFRDSANSLHSVQRTAFIEVVSPEVAAQTKGGGTNGLLLAGAAAAIIVIAYLAYRRFFRKKQAAR